MSARAGKRARIVGDSETAHLWRDAAAALPELVLDSDGAPEVAVVGGPTAERAQRCIELIRAGADLIVEPPLATTRAEAERVLALARRARREVLVAAPARFAPALTAARRAIQAGRLGRLRQVEIAFGRKLDARSSWRSDPAASGGGVWMDLGPRALEVAEALAGPTRRIRMTSACEAQDAGVEDAARVETDHGAGVQGGLEVSWNEAEPAPLARCAGDEGEILVGTSRTVLRNARGETRLGPGYEELDAAGAALETLLRLRCTPYSADLAPLRALAALHAAYRSQRDGRWERVPER